MEKRLFTLSVFLIPVMLYAVMAFSGCESNEPPPAAAISDAREVGEGDSEFTLEVTDNGGELTRFIVRTNEKTIGAALLEVGLIEGEESQYGLFVKTVNGVTADYAADKAYWAFYVDGEYATSGADSVDIEQGKTYAFVYTED